jgi:glycosyltransferase involved in cell wall biosynthesis
MQEAITFAGRQPNEAIPHFLNQSRIFVMASAFEGLPVAMIEALSCGLPVVVPDVGDIGDVAQDGVNARLIKDVGVNDFVEELLPLLETPQEFEKLSQGALQSRKVFVERYAMAQVKAFWQEVLSEKEDAS